MSKIIMHSEEETVAFASSFAKKVSFGTMIALHGNLGSGKTVFARGFAQGLKIDDYVTSPTFTIVQEYPIDSTHNLYHLDLYRINDENDAIAFGIDEFIFDPNSIALVEWPARIEGLWPNKTINIYLEHISETERSITIEGDIV
jgi:tRNA threonylcarbamoyladenosine biosynthesis protein TsaE